MGSLLQSGNRLSLVVCGSRRSACKERGHSVAFSRDQASQPRAVDVDAVLAEAARLLRPTLGEQIEIEAVPAAGVAPALVDPHQLMTALLNADFVSRPQAALTVAASTALETM